MAFIWRNYYKIAIIRRQIDGVSGTVITFHARCLFSKLPKVYENYFGNSHIMLKLYTCIGLERCLVLNNSNNNKTPNSITNKEDGKRIDVI